MNLAIANWLEAAPDEVKRAFGGSIHVINFWHAQRNRCFQIPGSNDGSISEECKVLFREEFDVFDTIIKVTESW
jgi:hypothetical protein